MTVDTASFTLSRDMACTPDRLWHLLTDAKAREVWGTPSDEYVLVADQIDTRVGGVDRHRCGPQDAPEFIVDTRWYRLANPVAAFTETLLIGGETLTVSLVGCSIAPSEKGAHLTVELSVHSFVGPDGPAEHEAGWSHALGRLEDMITAES